jgi:hypothetical protein
LSAFAAIATAMVAPLARVRLSATPSFAMHKIKAKARVQL